jgi:hypothetical protein
MFACPLGARNVTGHVILQLSAKDIAARTRVWFPAAAEWGESSQHPANKPRATTAFAGRGRF